MKTKEEPSGTVLQRRAVVLGIAAGLAALAERGAAVAQPAVQPPFRVDLHHHVIPPKWVDAARSHKPDNTWGPNIVGFGQHRQVYANGKEADWMLIAFSPRKQNLTLYIGGFEENADLMAKLGTHSCGKGCLYIKRLSDVHLPTLKKLVVASVKRRSANSA